MPVVTIIFATGPLPVSIFDSKTIPVALDQNLFSNLKFQLEELWLQSVYLYLILFS